jgi:hypothetical protein
MAALCVVVERRVLVRAKCGIGIRYGVAVVSTEQAIVLLQVVIYRYKIQMTPLTFPVSIHS